MARCSQCDIPLVPENVDGRRALVCPDCGSLEFMDVKG